MGWAWGYEAGDSEQESSGWNDTVKCGRSWIFSGFKNYGKSLSLI